MIARPERRLRLAPLLLFAFAGLACATSRPAAREARRGEEAVERAPSPRPAPRPVATRAAIPAPPLFDAAPPAPPRPLSDLAASGAARDVGEVVDDLRFAAGTTLLDAPSRARLDALVVRLQGSGGAWSLEIQGHADASGSDAQNILLGLRRAEAVRDYLRRVRGVPADRMAVVSLGAAQPVADNATAEGRARNRRAVVLVLR